MNLITETPAPIARSFQGLSFVGDDSGIWQPSRTGRYADDCEQGRDYARELVDHMRAHSCPMLLGHICKEMAPATWSGVEVGFFQALSEFALAVPAGRLQ